MTNNVFPKIVEKYGPRNSKMSYKMNVIYEQIWVSVLKDVKLSEQKKETFNMW
jgi:hypothetical protein